MFKMNPEVKKKWVNALLSGEYKQTTDGWMNNRTEGGLEFCALGVLEEIRRKELKKGLSYIEDNENVLSPKVAKWAGIDMEEKYANGAVLVNPKLKYPTIVSMNDTAHYTFKQIAKIIDTNL